MAKAILTLVVSAIIWLGLVWFAGSPPAAWDWYGFFYPALETMASGQSPYTIPGTYHVYPLLMVLFPLAFAGPISYPVVAALNFLAVFMGTQFFSRGNNTEWGLLAVVFGRVFSSIVWMGQIVFVELAGVVLGVMALESGGMILMALAVFLLSLVPPNSAPLLVWLLWCSWRRYGVSALLLLVAPCLWWLMSFVLGGWWVGEIPGSPIHAPWNFSIWEWGGIWLGAAAALIVGLLLIGLIARGTHAPFVALLIVAATYLVTPYITSPRLISLVVPAMALIGARSRMLALGFLILSHIPSVAFVVLIGDEATQTQMVSILDYATIICMTGILGVASWQEWEGKTG